MSLETTLEGFARRAQDAAADPSWVDKAVARAPQVVDRLPAETRALAAAGVTVIASHRDLLASTAPDAVKGAAVLLGLGGKENEDEAERLFFLSGKASFEEESAAIRRDGRATIAREQADVARWEAFKGFMKKLAEAAGPIMLHLLMALA